MNKTNVTAQSNGVKISFSKDMQKQKIVDMVQRCQSGGCDCMSDESKTKIKDMRISGTDGNVELNLEGDINIEEIQKAVLASPVLK